VNIPGFGYNKLNSAYAMAYNAASGTPDAKRGAGGAKLIQVIENLTGLTIDHYVQVDLIGFYRISLAVGPINVDMCAAVKEPDSGIDLHKGVNSIEGKQALAFVRQRYNFPNGLGDLDRVQRQRYFLTAAFRKLTSAGVLLNPGKLQKLLNAVQSSLFMDPGLNPQTLAEQMINLSADNIVGETIPTDGFGTSQDGQSIVKVNPNEVKTFVAQLVGSAPAPHPTTSASSHTGSSAGSSGGGSTPKPSPTKSAPIDAGCIN
jgi:LCP family protein required for cell wall assembly